MRVHRKSSAMFSLAQMTADFANGNFAEFASLDLDRGAMGGNRRPGMSNAAWRSAGMDLDREAMNSRKPLDRLSNQVNKAKNKVAVLVKGAGGKTFIQQRWKNVQDAAGAAGNAAKQAGGAIKANPGKSALAVGAIAAAGAGGAYLIANKPKQKSDRQLKAEAFDVYKSGKPGLGEKAGILPDRRTQSNPYR